MSKEEQADRLGLIIAGMVEGAERSIGELDLETDERPVFTAVILVNRDGLVGSGHAMAANLTVEWLEERQELVAEAIMDAIRHVLQPLGINMLVVPLGSPPGGQG